MNHDQTMIAVRFLVILGCLGWIIGTQAAHTDRLKRIESTAIFCTGSGKP